MIKQTHVKLLGKIKEESTRNKTKPFRYRFGGFIDKYFSTLDEAKAFQRDFSEKEARLGVDTAKLFESPELLKASERAFSILRSKGIDLVATSHPQNIRAPCTMQCQCLQMPAL